MEGMETAVDRGLQHQERFSNEEIASFFESLSRRLHMLLDDEPDR